MKKRFKKIYVEITNKCNLNCSFCTRTKKKKRDMSIEEFKTVIDKIKDYTDYVYLHVQGEPLLHKDLEEFLKICEDNNLKVNITTNGTLINKYVDIFNRSKSLRQINISLHSENNKEDYFDEVFIACSKLSSSIYISYRIWNLNTLKPTKELLNIVNMISEYYNVDKEKLINDKSIKVDINKFVDKDNLFEWPDMNNSVEKDGFCYALKTHIGILSDGTVVPCCLDASGVIELGNIFKESIEDILNKQLTKDIIEGFRNNKAVHLLCRKCNFRERFE
jgi:radical SAM protein with 4Fe4S-binding SPASM domain